MGEKPRNIYKNKETKEACLCVPIYIYVYIYIYMCVCVCMCVCILMKIFAYTRMLLHKYNI